MPIEDKLPGYARAMRRADRLENYWRDYAFLGIDDEIATQRVTPEGRLQTKIRVHPLTLRMFIQLLAARSPFLAGGTAGPQHVYQFLWRLSPSYAPHNHEARAAFLDGIKNIDYPRSVRAIRRFVDRMLHDRPAESEGGAKCDVSLGASLVHFLARSYGWSADQVLDTPMPALFQYVRCIQRSEDSGMTPFNPLRDRWTQRMLDKRGRTKGTTTPKPTAKKKASRFDDAIIAAEKARRNRAQPTHIDVTGTGGCKASTETICPP